MISTKVHGYIDYMTGALLVLLPLILDIDNFTASTVLIVMGAGVIVYSLVTDYELGLLKILAMKTHLGIDLLGGAFLIASPWLFGFADDIYLPFVIIGIAEIGVSLLTEKKANYPGRRTNE